MLTIMLEIHTGMVRYLSLYSLIPFMDESRKHSYHFLAGAFGSGLGRRHKPLMDSVIPGPLIRLSFSKPRHVMVLVPSRAYRAGPRIELGVNMQSSMEIPER